MIPMSVTSNLFLKIRSENKKNKFNHKSSKNVEIVHGLMGIYNEIVDK